MQKLYMAVIVFMIISCGSSASTKNDQSKEEPKERYTLIFPNKMTFTRGVETSYDIEGVFSDSEKSVITIDDLPPQAIFKNNKITWKPSCEISIANGYFLDGDHSFKIRINLNDYLTGYEVQKNSELIVQAFSDKSPCKN